MINMPEELNKLYQNYIDSFKNYQEKYINWLKETKGTIFKLKVPPTAFHSAFYVNNPFESDSLTICNDGFCKIIGENSGRPIIRFMHMDLYNYQNFFFPDQKILDHTKYYVSVHNDTDYTYESLMDIIERPACNSEIIPFVNDIMNDDYELRGYMMHVDDIINNIKPWMKNLELSE